MRPPNLDGYTSVEVRYGDFPEPDLFQQVFGESCVRPRLRFMDNVKDDEAIASWLKETKLIFAPDERCRFVFDMGTLAPLRGVESVKSVSEYVAKFARDLRAQGGFFFFRESHDDFMVKNRIFNGTEVITCGDGFQEALPMLSDSRNSFSGEIREDAPWGNLKLKQRLEARKEEESWLASDLSNLHATYHYVGEPQRDYSGGRPTGVVIDHGNGIQEELTTGCDVYEDPHLSAPWRRLWYALGYLLGY